MVKMDYKSEYAKLPGKTLDKVRALIKKNHARWDIEEFDDMVNDILSAESSTPEDMVDILELIINQQGGNPEFKRAFFTLKAEVTKAHQRSVQGIVDVEVPVVEEGEVEDE